MDFVPAFGDNGGMTSRTTTDTTVRRLAAVIVAAGGGTRMGEGPEKQFRTLAGRSVLAHSASAFLDHPTTARVVIVVAAGHEADAMTALGDLAGDARVVIVAGGARRQDSVAAGLAAVIQWRPWRCGGVARVRKLRTCAIEAGRRGVCGLYPRESSTGDSLLYYTTLILFLINILCYSRRYCRITD